MPKPVKPLARAVRDFDDIIDYYLVEAAEGVAERFVDALDAAYDFISHTPGGGSGRIGIATDLPDLRSWNVRGFPYLVLYVEQPDRIDVVRILHSHRDLPAELNAPTN